MIKLLISFLFSVSFFSGFFCQGVIFDKKIYSDAEQYQSKNLGFTNTLKDSISLRKYCPPVKDQYGATCVGWAAAYGCLSIMHNKINKIIDLHEKEAFAFDPNFLYSWIDNNRFNNNCQKGTYPLYALYFLENYGCKKMYAPKLSKCNKTSNRKSFAYADPFKIKNYEAWSEILDGLSLEGKINHIKEYLSNEKPLFIGVETFLSIDSDQTIKTGLWELKQNEESDGGHAMTLIGYNDFKYGGAFELMNSWGNDYGDDGFLWIKYEDFIKVYVEIYSMEIFNQDINNYCLLGDCNNSYSYFSKDSIITYEGEFLDGELHGFGIGSFSNSSIWIGNWNNGKPDGKGLFYFPEDQKFYRVKCADNILSSAGLGFANFEDSEEINEFEEMINEYETKGFIKTFDPENIEYLKHIMPENK